MSKVRTPTASGLSVKVQEELEDIRLDDKYKGIPGGTSDLRLGDVDRQGWKLLNGDLPLPVAVLKTTILENNSHWMTQFLQATGAAIAPHGKTTMSPQLFHRQLVDGAWAITVATVSQLQICRRFGMNRILLANQLIGRQAISYVVSELAADPEFEFYALADSVEGVMMIAAEAKRANLQRPVNLLLEVGLVGGRTGCRSPQAALSVARTIKDNSRWLALRGVEGFEGLVKGSNMEEREKVVGEFMDFLLEIAAVCHREGLFAPGQIILSAGGSRYYDIVAERLASTGVENALILIRSGCYLTHDSAVYRDYFDRIKVRSVAAKNLPGGLLPALEVWAYVQSRPEPGRLILTVGRRDVSDDVNMPTPLSWFSPGSAEGPQPLPPGYKVVELNDQHAHVVMPTNSPLGVGDMVALGISHPCTTFDRWQIMFLVDDIYNVTGAIRTYF